MKETKKQGAKISLPKEIGVRHDGAKINAPKEEKRLQSVKPQKPKNVYVREFLNLPAHCGGARIKANISDGRYNINIFDCHHQIDLHGTYVSEDDFENALYKLDTLAEALAQVRQAIVKSRESMPRERLDNAKLTLDGCGLEYDEDD